MGNQKCVYCGDKKATREMYCILMRKGIYGSQRVVSYVCQSCVANLLDNIGASIPDFEKESSRKFYRHTRCPVCLEEVYKKDKFCPNCGAKMDGVNDR